MSTKYIASNWRLLNKAGVDSYKNDNYGLTYDGSNEVIQADDFQLTNSIDTCSYSAWVNIDSSATGVRGIFGKGGSSAFEFNVRYYTAGTNLFIIQINGTTVFQNSSLSLATDTWHHIVVVIDRNLSAGSNIKLFVNNAEITNESSVTFSQFTSTGYPLYIGAEADTAFSSRFKWLGKISSAAVFDYALSSTQISTLYGSSSLGAGNPMALKPQPVAFWNLADNSASNPLTQPNEAVEDASVFDFIPNDHIDCGNLSIFDDLTSFSFSCWFNSDVKGNDDGILGKWNTGTDRSFALNLETSGASSNIRFIVFNSGGTAAQAYISGSDWSTGNWYNVIGTYDGSNVKLYLDGVLKDTVALTGTVRNATQSFRIGVYGSSSYFDGEISNIVFWNSDQSSEISNIYNSGVPATTYTNTPTAWYKLDQSANWEADSSGAWQIPDAVSAYPQSFNFDGDYIDCGQDTSLDTGDLSVSIWLNKDSTAFGTQYIFNNNNGSSPAGFAILMNNINKVFLYRKTTTHSANTGYTDVSFTTDTWHHLCFTYNDTTKAFVAYFNGVSFHTSTATSITGGASGNITIGTNSGLTGNNFIGKLSNAAIFNTALDSSQVETLYNNGSPLTTAIASDNLKGWWKLDNTATWTGSAYSIPDASGNGNTGTSSGMTEQNLVNNNVSALNGESSGMTSASLVLSDLTRAVPYGDGYSFNFDSASSDYIDTTLDIDANSDFSISFWFNWDQDQKVIITDGSFDAWSSIGYGFQILSNGSVSFLVGDSGASTGKTISSNAGSITANTWYHIVGVCDLSNEIRLYLNGTSVDSTSVGSSRNETSNNLRIAGDYSSSKRPFDGKISNISVFNESLISTEVMKLYSNGVPQDLSSFTPAPIAFYPLGSNSFWNGSAWTVRDMIGSNDGTGVNLGQDALVGDSPRSSANGTGTNMDIESNITGSTKWSSNNSWSINMSSEARKEDTP
jgi:hypothetical protein